MNERDLFTAALHQDDPAAYVKQACAGDEALRRRVEALLDAHQQAGNLLQAGPSLAVGGSVLKALADGLTEVPHVQLRDPPSGTTAPTVWPSSPEMPGHKDPYGRLQLHGEIARGGMGSVLKGRDTDLGRDVAVKVLLETHAGKTELARRFVEEAQIAGQLQHPGITPVYELGVFPDKRPYFTMKLVKGQTLAALLAARKDPAADRTKFVGIFAQVCQTLAYAHARRVIHRDLKPANVMVGAFGEVQVMDWGLANVLKEGGVVDELKLQQQEVSVIHTQPSAGSETPEAGSNTQAGSVMGTPAYMAPEQARGNVDLVDERADVFGLGAILCVILTGKPPYVARSSEPVQFMAVMGDLDEALARLDGCGADAELIALAKRCLAAELGGRPRHAGEVAEAVTAYQNSVAERLRQAELARAAEVARAEEARATAAAERRARRLTLGLAASVLLFVVVGAAGGLWAQRQWAERAADLQRQTTEADRQRQGVEAALDKAKELRQKARWAEARAVLEQTRDWLGDTGPDDLRQRLDQATSDLALVDRLERIRLKRATIVEGQFDDRTAERDYAKEFREVGLGKEGESAETVAARVRSSAVAEQLVAALDDWAVVAGNQKRRAWLLEVARHADPDAWRDRFRDPKVWGDRAALEKLAGELLRDKARLAKLKPPLLAALGVVLNAARADAVPLLAAAQAHHPDDFLLNFHMGNVLSQVKRWDEAVGYYRGALAARPEVVAVYNNLGLAQQGKGRLDEAIASYKEAIRLKPDYADARINFGMALKDKGWSDEAIATIREAIRRQPGNGTAHRQLGWVLWHAGRQEEGMASCREALRLQPDDAFAHNDLGVYLRGQGKLDEAIASLREAIRLNPDHPWAKNNLEQAVRERQRAALALDPKDAKAHYIRGNALRTKGHLDEAINEYREALALDPKLVQSYGALGQALLQLGRFEEAREATGRCLKLLPPGHPLRPPVTRQLRQCERSLALEVKLAAVLKGEQEVSDAAGLLELARFAAHQKRMFAATAGLYQDSFRAHPGWADAHIPPQPNGLPFTNRRFAAAAAAMAAAGAGDGAKRTDEQRAAWRRQALDWLRAELTAWKQRLDGATPEAKAAIAKLLADMQTDDWLASVRDAAHLDRLSVAERDACRQFWAEVAALRRKTQDAK